MNGLTTEFINSCARELGAKRLRTQLPWETSPWEDAFSSKPKPVIPKPDWVDFPVQPFCHSSAVATPVKLDRFNARVHLSEISWVAAESHKHNLALQCWKVIVMDSTCHTEFGRLLMQCIEHGRSDDYIWQVVSDAFSCKSTSTLKSRAASLLAFGRWKRSTCIDCQGGIFPISEGTAYDYLCELRRMHAAPSKGKRFLESLGFAKGLLGADVDTILKSSRVRGVALGFEKAPTKKKSPFSVQQVRALEHIAVHGTGQQSIFAGYLCFLVHCRLRWSDGQHCITEPTLDLDCGRGFIEASLYHHKTAQKRRTSVVRLLPVAGVLPGLTGLDWASAWLSKRLQCGLKACMSQPTMPAPLACGGWSPQPLSSSEASVWLRELLQPFGPEALKDVATHSAKATILSWMSKANISLSLRRLAGYHVLPGDKSALEYSRDAASPILRQIEAIFIAVRSNVFRPDESRSRRWSGAQTLEEAVKLAASRAEHVETEVAHQMMPGESFDDAVDLTSNRVLSESLASTDELPGAQSCQTNLLGDSFNDDLTLFELKNLTCAVGQGLVLPPQGLIAPDLDSDVSDMSDSCSSVTDTESDSDEAERRVELDGEANARDLVAPSDIAGQTCYRHVKSKKLHLVGRCLYNVTYFKRGRKCNPNYELLEGVPAFTAHGCMTCFGWSTQTGDSDSST
eukprot:s1864_g22.t1